MVRPWKLRIVDSAGNDVSGGVCKVIAGDGGFRRAPVQFPIAGLFIGAAERYEVACDFTKYAGQTLYIWNVQDEDRMKDVPFFCYSHLAMKLVVGAAKTTGCGVNCPTLNPVTPFVPSLDRVLSQKDVDQALAMVANKQCTRTFRFGRSNGQW